MIGAAKPAEDSKPARRQKIRFATEVANSREKNSSQHKSKATADAAAQLRTPQPQIAAATALQPVSVPPGPPYPVASPQTAATTPAPQFAATQRLPEVRLAGYSEQLLY
jgi:hypothetical protein